MSLTAGDSCRLYDGYEVDTAMCEERVLDEPQMRQRAAVRTAVMQPGSCAGAEVGWGSKTWICGAWWPLEPSALLQWHELLVGCLHVMLAWLPPPCTCTGL